jgi:uncharacterized protein (DUF1499 family)
MKGYVIPVILGVLCFAGCKGIGENRIGLVEGKLRPCPSSPNCVSTQADAESRRMEPIPFAGSHPEAQQRLLEVIKGMKGSRLALVKDDSIHAEFTSALFKFVDDVEFYFDSQAKIIHFRSASRVGYYDFGVNRKRMEYVRGKFLSS